MRRRGDPDWWQRGEEGRSVGPWPVGGSLYQRSGKRGRGWSLEGITHSLWFCSEQTVGVAAASPAPPRPKHTH